MTKSVLNEIYQYFSLCISYLQTKPEEHRLNRNNNFKIVHLGDEVVYTSSATPSPPKTWLASWFKSDSCTKHLPYRSRCAEMCLLRTIHSLFVHYFTMSAERGAIFAGFPPWSRRRLQLKRHRRRAHSCLCLVSYKYALPWWWWWWGMGKRMEHHPSYSLHP